MNPAALKSITIEMHEDGTFMVGTEAEASELPEGTADDMAMDAQSGMQPAGSIDEALEMARMMLSSEESQSMSKPPKDEEAEAAAAAFAMGRGK